MGNYNKKVARDDINSGSAVIISVSAVVILSSHLTLT